MTATPLHTTPSLIKPPARPVRLRNRWRAERFIHVEHEALEVGAVEPGWLSAHWSFRVVENSPFVVISNALHEDYCLQMRDSGLLCGKTEPWQGAHWYVERIKGTVFVRFRNRWRQDCYINCEGGSLEATPINESWQSAQWECV